MHPILCAIWMIPLGAALMALLAWPFSRRSARPPAADVQNPLRILYLDPRSFAALGSCAKLERLRRLTPDCIGELLSRSPFDDKFPRPSKDRYSTWPIQANLWCAGDLHGLRQYQKKLTLDLGPDDASSAISLPLPAAERRFRSLLLCALALTLLAFLFWLIARLTGACQEGGPAALPARPVVPPCPVIKKITYNLQTDTLFDFNTHESVTDEHFKKSKDHLANYLSAFDGIQIKSINAHTDPIGATDANKDLATRRAGFLRDMLQQVMATPSHEGQFADVTLPELTESSGPAPGDKRIWDACYEKFYLLARKKDGLVPLDDLSLNKRQGRPACSAGLISDSDEYAACARITVPKAGTKIRPGYPTRAERFRELTSCLAPMRYAYFEFTFTGLHKK